MSFYKKLLLVCLSLSFIQSISAQDTIKPFQSRFILKVYPSQMMIGHNPLTSEWGLHGEISFSKHASTELALSYNTNSVLFEPNTMIPDSLSNIKVITSGRSMRAGVRFYLGKKKDQMQGLYLGPAMALSSTNIYDRPDKNVSIRLIYASLGLKFGYQIILPRGLCFDFNVGLAGRYGIGLIKVNNESDTVDGFAPKLSLGLGLGYCFK